MLNHHKIYKNPFSKPLEFPLPKVDVNSICCTKIETVCVRAIGCLWFSLLAGCFPGRCWFCGTLICLGCAHCWGSALGLGQSLALPTSKEKPTTVLEFGVPLHMAGCREDTNVWVPWSYLVGDKVSFSPWLPLLRYCCLSLWGNKHTWSCLLPLPGVSLFVAETSGLVQLVGLSHCWPCAHLSFFDQPTLSSSLKYCPPTIFTLHQVLSELFPIFFCWPLQLSSCFTPFGCNLYIIFPSY